MISLHFLILILLNLTSTIITLYVSVPANVSSGPPSTAQPPSFNPVNSLPGIVDPSYYTDWAGNLDPDDCTRAYGLLNGRIAYWNPATRWTFWSRRWVIQPEGLQWELPFGASYRD